jgi:hypothetical protein
MILSSRRTSSAKVVVLISWLFHGYTSLHAATTDLTFDFANINRKLLFCQRKPWPRKTTGHSRSQRAQVSCWFIRRSTRVAAKKHPCWLPYISWLSK